MGQGLLQTFERYYITVAILAKNGSGTLTRSDLERTCIQTAQRISELNEFAAPEFYDRGLFRHFISLLRDVDVIRTNEEGKLEFTEAVNQIDTDARYILGKDIRHAVIHAVPEIQASISGMSLDSR
jgi:glycerol-3-phosphate O-acyltransferase